MQNTSTTLSLAPSQRGSLGLPSTTAATSAAPFVAGHPVQPEQYRCASPRAIADAPSKPSEPATASTTASSESNANPAPAVAYDEYGARKYFRTGWNDYECPPAAASGAANEWDEWNDEYIRRQFTIFPLRGVSSRYAPYPTAAGSAPIYQQSSGFYDANYTEQYRTAHYAHAPATTAEHQQPNEQQSNDGVSRNSNR